MTDEAGRPGPGALSHATATVGAMGKQNRARRAAKARARQSARRDADARQARSSRAAGPTGGPEPFATDDRSRRSEPQRATDALLSAAHAQAGSNRRIRASEDLLSMSAPVVDRAAEELALTGVSAAWGGGWQPSELARHLRLRGSSAATGRLGRTAIAADHAGRSSSTLDARWAAQVQAMELPDGVRARGWIRRWSDEERIDRSATLDTVVDLLGILVALRRIEQLLPPPGSAADPSRSGRTDGTGGPTGTSPSEGTELDPLLEKIRNLLAKAESTTFEAEATALTAKAQELMTRHAVDAAALHAGDDTDSELAPVAIRIPIDAPYTDAKSLLLQTVALASRCRSVHDPDLDLSTVVGFPDDVAIVEVLFTSLLVQAQTALTDAARHAPPGTRTRSQSYRSAFLLSYTHRIGDRLEEINQHVIDQATIDHGGSFLPVLRSRSDRVEDHMRAMFTTMTSKPVRGGYDRAGWASGQLAADRAAINLADLEQADPTTTGSPRPVKELT